MASLGTNGIKGYWLESITITMYHCQNGGTEAAEGLFEPAQFSKELWHSDCQPHVHAAFIHSEKVCFTVYTIAGWQDLNN